MDMKKSELQQIIKEELKAALKEAAGYGPISKYFKGYSKDVLQAAYDIEEALLIAKVDEEVIAIVAGAVQDIVDAATDEAYRDAKDEPGPGGFYS